MSISGAQGSNMTSWPEATAIPVLFQFLDKNDNPTHRILALQGVTRLAGQRDLGNEKRLEALKKVIDANSGLATSGWLGKVQQGNDPAGRKRPRGGRVRRAFGELVWPDGVSGGWDTYAEVTAPL